MICWNTPRAVSTLENAGLVRFLAKIVGTNPLSSKVSEVESIKWDHSASYWCLTIRTFHYLTFRQQKSAAYFQVQACSQGFCWKSRIDFLVAKFVDEDLNWVILMTWNGNFRLLINKCIDDVDYI